MKQDLSIFNLSSFWLFFRYCVTATICMENGTSAKSERYFLDDICYKIRPSKYFWHLEVRNQPIYFCFVSKKDSLLQNIKRHIFLEYFQIEFNLIRKIFFHLSINEKNGNLQIDYTFSFYHRCFVCFNKMLLKGGEITFVLIMTLSSIPLWHFIFLMEGNQKMNIVI